jgi:hypothetical protein
MNVTDFIGIGKENAVTRGELVAVLNLPDRQIRRLIQEARCQGVMILNAQDGAGYYISNDAGELEKQYRANRNRAMSILLQQKYIRLRLREIAAADQVTLEDGFRMMAADAQLTLDVLEAEQEVSASG